MPEVPETGAHDGDSHAIIKLHPNPVLYMREVNQYVPYERRARVCTSR